MYTIAQITDIHIGQAGEDTFDVDVRNNLVRTVAQSVRDGAQELVVTGDLAFRSGHPDIYAWLADELSKLSIPWWVLPGNHDDPAMMRDAFGERLYSRQLCVRTLGQRTLAFVDSGPSSVDATQLDALREVLRGTVRTPLVFVHHPPAPLGVPYMDGGHMLQNHQELLSVLRGGPCGANVFCGHYHVERTLSLGNVSVFATPSTFFQIDPRHKEFVVDHRNPGYRVIHFDDNTLQTAVHWL